MVYALYPIPELSIGIGETIMFLTVFGTDLLLDLEKTATVAYYLERHRFNLVILNRPPYETSLRIVEPFDMLYHNLS